MFYENYFTKFLLILSLCKLTKLCLIYSWPDEATVNVNEYTSNDFHYCQGKHDQHVSVLSAEHARQDNVGCRSDGTALQTQPV